LPKIALKVLKRGLSSTVQGGSTFANTGWLQEWTNGASHYELAVLFQAKPPSLVHGGFHGA